MREKYLFFIGTLESGGAERVVSILSRELAEKSEVSILTYYDRQIAYDIDERVKLSSVTRQTKSGNILKNLLYIRRYFKDNGGTVLSFLAPFNILALVAHFGIKSPIIVADRSDPRKSPQNKVIRKLRNFLYRFADGVVLQTEYNRNYFNNCIKKKSAVIYNPVNLGEYEKAALDSEKKKKIVTVGRLIPPKNHKLLIDAFCEVSKDFPEYTLEIFGDGEEKENLARYIAELGLAEKVHLMGRVKNVPEATKDAELFVLSSNFEGMPNALIEAMCLGLPVISTRVSGAEDMIKDGESGFLVDAGDTAGLAEAMKKMLASDELRKNMAQKATEIYGMLETSKIVKQWEAFARK